MHPSDLNANDMHDYTFPGLSDEAFGMTLAWSWSLITWLEHLDSTLKLYLPNPKMDYKLQMVLLQPGNRQYTNTLEECGAAIMFLMML